MIFNEKFYMLFTNSLKFAPMGGLHNGLVPNRRQAFSWTNADPIHRRIYGAPGDDLNMITIQPDAFCS